MGVNHRCTCLTILMASKIKCASWCHLVNELLQGRQLLGVYEVESLPHTALCQWKAC